MTDNTAQPDTPLSTAMAQVNPFRVMAVMQRAAELEAQGKKIVHMEVGEPDFVTADPIITAAKLALDAGQTSYTQAPGIPALREAIARHYQLRNNVEIDPQRILVTPGASAGLMLLAHLLVSPGAGILMADPAYPCVRNFVHLVHGIPQLLPVSAQSNFQPTLDQVAANCKASTSGLWLASPSNPTGTIVDREELHKFSAFTAERGLHLLVDEIYHGLHYVDELASIVEVTDQAFLVNSFSKYFGMTGWRLGWIVVPANYIDKARVLAQNLYISAPTIAQHAAIAALDEATRPELERRREAFRQRRDYLQTALQELGFTVPPSVDGAFYIYAGIEHFSDNAEDFCAQMLNEHGVAITPGTDFGDYRAQQFVRFAFTTSMDNLELGIARLRKALA